MDNNYYISKGKEGIEELIKLVTPEGFENLHWELKTKSDNNGETELNGDDMANFARALSGFANSQGGIILWGVKDAKEIRKDPTNKYRLIKSPGKFIERLNRLTADLISPIVDNVQHKIIFEGSDGGVIASIIPESDKTPHMSIQDHKYYKRSGNQFKPMQHFDLEDMFGRRARPKLKLYLSTEIRNSSNNYKYELNIILQNIGKNVTASYGFDILYPNKDLFQFNDKRSNELQNALLQESIGDNSNIIKYRSIHDINKAPLYPDEEVKISPNSYRLGQILMISNVSYTNMPIKYRIYSENMSVIVGEIKYGDIVNN